MVELLDGVLDKHIRIKFSINFIETCNYSILFDSLISFDSIDRFGNFNKHSCEFRQKTEKRESFFP